ncbi:MltR family transcriptional regulator [Chryseobacterium scophthalmum]|uniref:MltR family transcriptional regulator n=1 Tax=Chryseobacterium scophthalmum TaxID=59733 RepID=UPI003D081EC6
MDKEIYKKLIEAGINKKFNFDNLPEEFQNQIKEYIEFKYLLTTESDRGAVLFASSYIDFLLEKILRVKMIGNKKHLDSLFDFNGALGTFSSRIAICYSMGIFPKEYYDEINTIRKIRNIFGHSPEKLDFESEKISKIVQNLKFLPANFEKPNRTKFNRSLSFLIGALEGISKIETKFEENNKDKFEEIFESLRNLGMK